MHRPSGILARTLATLLAVALCALASTASALDPSRRLTQAVHRAWSIEDGLPSASVTVLLPTSDGYLWIGTNNGLARFDGLRFAAFDRRNTAALRTNSIASLVEDARGDLWVGVLGGGVLRHRDGRFEPVEGLGADARIVALAAGADGALWAGGYEGLARIRDGVVERSYGTADGLDGDPVLSLAVGADGALFVASRAALFRFADERFERIDQPFPSLRDVFVLRDGTLVARSIEGALSRRAGAAFVPWNPAGVPADATVRWIHEDAHGVWLGTEQHGLFRVRRETAERIGGDGGADIGRVRTLVEDPAGNLWVGSYDRGLHRFRDAAFATWGRPEGLASDTVYAVLADARGDTWAATSDGLARLHDAARWTTRDGLSGDSIRALHDGSDGLWVGSTAGLDRLRDGAVVESLTTASGLPLNRVTAVLEHDGELFVATAGGGLARRADGAFTMLSSANGLADDFVYALHRDARGVLWVGTGNGLSSVREGRVTDDARALAIDAPVTSFHEDARGVLWIGTEGRALFRWADGRLAAYERVAGFPEDTVYTVLEDADERLWFSSYRGVFRVPRAQLDAVADGTRRSVDATVYSAADGLRSVEGNGGQQPAGFRGPDGRLWFATLKGLSVVDPSRADAVARALPVAIESVIADDRLLPAGDGGELPAQTRRVEIRYAAPDLSTPESTRFRLRLDGFDPDWQDVGRRRVVHYTSLPRGDYALRVAASTGDGSGAWDGPVATYRFSVAPQVHETWWFRTLALLAALGALAVVYRLRVAWLQAQNAVLRERQRIAGEIHDNLAQSFSGVIYQAEAAIQRIDRDPAAAARHLETVCDLATHGADAARRSMWELGARCAQGGALLRAITGAARRLAQGRDVAVDVSGSATTWELPEQVEHQVLCVAQGAIANAVEHARCASIVVRLDYGAQALTLCVTDDGVGFDTARVVPREGRGFGLASLRERAAQAGGRLALRSAPGAGTTVELAIPRRQWAWYLRGWLSALSRRDPHGNDPQDPHPPR